MENIQTYIIDGQEVFLADDLKQNNPVYFKGCSKTIRNIIGRKKIPDHHIVYATKTKTGYNVCETDIKKARLFLAKEWVLQNFEFKEENNGDEVVDNKKYEEAPPLLFLSPEDKFRGADGETIEIETRGEREYDKVYFRSKDIENGFGCNIRALLFQENNSYIRGKHYETFIRKVKGNNPSNETQQNQKTLYLTFKGLTRFLFASHNKNAEHF